MTHQVLTRRARLLDGSSRRDMVSSNAVAENREHATAGDVLNGRRTWGNVIKIRSALDVSGIIFPRVCLSRGRGEVLPALVAREDGRVILAEHLRIDAAGDGLIDLLLRRPQVAQIDRLVFLIAAERLVLEVDADASRQCVR